MRKILLAIMLAVIIAIFGAIIGIEPKDGRCAYCSNAGAECVTDLTCIGDCYCAKNMGSATGFCAPYPD